MSLLPSRFLNRNMGAWAERRAARFLGRQRHRILARNFHCRFGEIDLVTCDPQEYLVFVEVRYRAASKFASAAESITRGKQDRLKKSAQIFIAKHPHLTNKPCRFDVVTLQRTSESGKITIDWIQNAFY